MSKGLRSAICLAARSAAGGLAVLSFAVVSLVAADASAKQDLRILFVGNSLTGTSNLPGLFRYFAQQKGFTPTIEESLKFNKTLADQLKDKNVVQYLKANKFDVVILQEYSDLPLRDPKAFRANVEDFQKLTGKAKTILFENWPHSDARSTSMELMDRTYATVANATHSTVARFGIAFEELKKRPGVDVYMPKDVKHPSPLVTYMNAALLLNYFYGAPVDTLTHQGCATDTGPNELGPASTPPLVDLDKMYKKEDVAAALVIAQKFAH